ncbi:hypothetical protein QPK87_17740 [Kamptonema cortianum]|nr:hypothetical protein [Geitlerinema splendidum]MDK3158398.1 hypothetical protein [Kamptonema cortianum]
MDKELFEKLLHEETLEGADALILEATLESGSGLEAAEWVKSLEDAEPSLAWRSQLNEKLSAFTPKSKSGNSFRWFGAIAVGGAACLAAVMLFTATLDNAPKHLSSPDRVVSAQNPDEEFGMVLVSTHVADQTQISLGIQPPRRPAESGRFDWDSFR